MTWIFLAYVLITSPSKRTTCGISLRTPYVLAGVDALQFG